jgi:23S rRNA (guanosine2251-2'-O)-methyltransferase
VTPARKPPPRRRPPPAPEGRRKPADRGLGGEQVEGRQAVKELLLAGRRRVKDVWIAEGIDDAPILDEIRHLATQNRVPIRLVPRARLEGAARTEAPQGVLAHAQELPETPLADLVSTGREQASPFLVALDGVTDPYNLGAVLRTAECAGVTGIILPRHRAAHVTATVTKAAAGAVERLPMAIVAGLATALPVMAKEGVWTVGLDAEAPTSLFDLEVATEPVAVVLGAEGTGLSRLVRQRCDVLAAIPQFGALGSLNVSAAAAVALFEIARRRAI